MKHVFVIISCLAISLNSFSQDHCFEKCWENFDNSTLPPWEKNEKIVKDLMGCRAPNFEVKTIDGKELNLSELKGKVVVLNFWFQSCPPCIAELPALNNLYEDYKSEDVVFIAFGKDSAPSIINFLKNNAFSYHQVSGEFNLDRNYCIFSGYPTHMVIDKNGFVRQIFSGGTTDERAMIEAYNKLKPTIDKFLLE